MNRTLWGIVSFNATLGRPMTDLNPYEAPQVDESLTEEPWPAWLGTALRSEFACVVLTLLASGISVTPDVRKAWNAILLIAVGMTGLLTIVILITAIRYRIGWLVLLELIVIGLPLMMLFTVQFHR